MSALKRACAAVFRAARRWPELLLLACLLAWGATALVSSQIREARLKPFHKLSQLIDSYAIHFEHSPVDAGEVLAAGLPQEAFKRGWISEPLRNPYSGGPLRFVQPGQPHAAGDLLYLPAMLNMPQGEGKAHKPLPLAHHLILFGPPRDNEADPLLAVDFDLDGKRDEIALWDGWITCIKTSKGAGGSETLEQTLRRLGLEQYWIDEKEED